MHATAKISGKCIWFDLTIFTKIPVLKTAPTLPFLSGIYSTGPGLVPLSKNGLPDNRIFDIDDDYDDYIRNKSECRKELAKHFCTKDFNPATELNACNYIARELARSYPEKFRYDETSGEKMLENRITGEDIRWRNNIILSPTHYQSLFDAISNQVQEDLAVFQLDGDPASVGADRDWLAAIHLCSPNHWDPRDKVGRPFPEIHSPVPAMERTISQYKPMLKSVISKGPFARYAWGIDRDNKLNHHPAGPHAQTPRNADEYFIRMERQHLVGLPKVNAFLFTIRTYFIPVESLNKEERVALASAIRSMTLESLRYKRMDSFAERLVTALTAA